MLLVGILLVSGILMVAIQSVGYTRGGYNSEFWRLPLDDKLDHVAGHLWEWWWVSVWELIGLFALTGGVAGLTYLLSDSGEPVLAWVAFGGYLVSVLAWVYGTITQAASVSEAAKQRKDTGTTPAWIHGSWQGGYMAEGVWVVGSNLAYAVIGIAILAGGLVAPWAGWVALGLGVLIPIAVLIARDGFPQLGLLAPAVIGVALIIENL